MTRFAAGSHTLLWSLNARAILEIVDRDGPVARPEITRTSGLSKTAVGQILVELTRRGLVTDVGLDTTRRGPAATRYAIEATHDFGVAIDLGHHRMSACLVTVDGHTLGRREEHADHRSPEATALAVEALIALVSHQAGVVAQRISHAVIGVPAAVDPVTGQLRLASGLACGGAGLPEALAARLSMDIAIENDTNLAAVAEQRFGVARGLDCFALVSLGASVGAGIVIGGALHRGPRGTAGEIAYLPGADGVVDDSLGARSVATDAADVGLIGEVSAREIFARAHDGDAQAREVVERTGVRLGQVVSLLALTLDPQRIVRGGAMGSDELLLTAVRRYLSERATSVEVEVESSRAGPDAVLRGAAAQCWSTLRERSFAGGTTQPPP